MEPAIMDEIGLFPLATVLVPSERHPLHIFEPRYRELIGECVARSEAFGFLYHPAEGQREIGTRATVVEVLERFDDGRLNVMVAGGRIFRIVQATDGRSFLTARVEDVADEPDPPSADETAACLAAVERVAGMGGLDRPSLDDPATPASFAIAAQLGLPPDLKQDLLEERSERRRILALTEALEGPVSTQLVGQEIARRAATNGKVDHP